MANKLTMEAIKTALQNEDKSVKLYSDAAKNTKNPVVKIDKECDEDAMCVVKEFFGKNKAEFEKKIEGSKDDIKVYETGMEIEKEGFKFYKKAAQDSDDDGAKQLFEFLATEENVHYIFLEDQHAYLAKPDSWFLNEEKWILEG